MIKLYLLIVMATYTTSFSKMNYHYRNQTKKVYEQGFVEDRKEAALRMYNIKDGAVLYDWSDFEGRLFCIELSTGADKGYRYYEVGIPVIEFKNYK